MHSSDTVQSNSGPRSRCVISSSECPIHSAATPCQRGCGSFFPTSSNHQIAPPSSLTMTRCSQFSSSLCSKSHFPSSKVQPTNSLLLRPGTLQKDILSISPFHASPSLLNMQNAFQSIPVCLVVYKVGVKSLEADQSLPILPFAMLVSLQAPFCYPRMRTW